MKPITYLAAKIMITLSLSLSLISLFSQMFPDPDGGAAAQPGRGGGGRGRDREDGDLQGPRKGQNIVTVMTRLDLAFDKVKPKNGVRKVLRIKDHKS